MKTSHVGSLAVILTALSSTCAWAGSRGVTADIVTTQTNVIANDNRLENTTTGKFAQDALGRTRFEWNGQVTISDPVGGVFWQVDGVEGVAFRDEFDPAKPGPDTEGGHEDMALEAPEGLVHQGWLEGGAAEEPVVLEPRVVNGVECEGLLWKHEIPAGAVGNARPIDVEAEVWTTDAFGLPLTVLTVTRDPLNGTHRQELRNIREVDFGDDAFRPDDGLRVVEGRK